MGLGFAETQRQFIERALKIKRRARLGWVLDIGCWIPPNLWHFSWDNYIVFKPMNRNEVAYCIHYIMTNRDKTRRKPSNWWGTVFNTYLNLGMFWAHPGLVINTWQRLEHWWSWVQPWAFWETLRVRRPGPVQKNRWKAWWNAYGIILDVQVDGSNNYGLNLNRW